ncbi:DUF4138 domain-containing protein [Costertonia aggregata]|uniref:DUF4138 domain-containing protein n=1 Tax=Costertonia aggregata TaxID=343403 RepID=A0A7H9ATQ2_9FLAO|nr:DUF4138 domain-containing protein [Costertonia aggregata]QLG46863.1 DUF4138 domain-containing protein [Costertonia aggregata]
MKIKYVPLIFFVGFFFQVYAQEPKRILANESTTISFFFPSPISKVIAPAVNYKFEYDAGTTIGILRARKGPPSNLTVITNQGHIYSFALEFSEKVNDFNFILSPEDALGKTNINKVITKRDIPEKSPTEIDSVASVSLDTIFNIANDSISIAVNDTVTKGDTNGNISENPENNLEKSIPGMEDGDLYDKDREEYYRIFCENNYLQRTIFKRSFRQNKRVVVKLNNILEDREEIYLIMQLENNSKKEYKVNGLGFFLKKDELEPPKIITPLYTFNLQEIIDPESINEVVCVFKKFNLAPKEQLSVVLDEQDGNRTVLLPLDSKQINSPTN